MAVVHAEEEAVIPAPPDRVYAVLADYNHHHPRILPERYFSDLFVEEGGVGTGTVFSVIVRILGTKSRSRMAVTEPRPGFVLRETDLGNGLITDFVLSPVEGGTQTHLKIATEWEPGGGIAGWIEKTMIPSILRRIYRAELAQLADYLRQEEAAGSK